VKRAVRQQEQKHGGVQEKEKREKKRQLGQRFDLYMRRKEAHLQA
jgi:hypothetical protein